MSAAEGGVRSTVVSGWTAAGVQAGWTFRRLLRGRLLWVAGFLALMPISFAAIVVESGHTAKWSDLVASLLLLARVVAPLLTASLLADEFEQKTFTYLWSRPFPRWSVLVGKLVATLPVSVAILCAATLICFQLGQRGASPDTPWQAMALARGLGAVSLAAVGLALVSAGIAVLMPRHGLGVAYAYVLVLDISLGSMPFSIAKLSISYHVWALGGIAEPGEAEPAVVAAAWLLGIGLVWLILGLWRLARSEFASSER
jgi:ABC-type transport system involved in multi-copper enzyme maturation permease subunit